MTFPQPADFPYIPTLCPRASVRGTKLQILQAISAISINITLQIMHIPRIHFTYPSHICLDSQVTCCYNAYMQHVTNMEIIMHLNDLITKFSGTTEYQQKAIFSTLFIATNRLQTLFDGHIPEISLKQFMLLSIVRQSKEPLTFTQSGNLLGCSRQNIKKLADVLMKKGFVTISPNPCDPRAMGIRITQKAEDYFQKEFSVYQEELRYLFEVYTTEEIETLFTLLSKLYTGIEYFEKRISGGNTETEL